MEKCKRSVLYAESRVCLLLNLETCRNLYAFLACGGKNENRPKPPPEMGAKREPYHFVNFDCAPSPSHTHRPQTKWKTMEQLDFAFVVNFPSCCARANLQPLQISRDTLKFGFDPQLQIYFRRSSILFAACVCGRGRGHRQNLRNGKVRASPPFPGWFSVDFRSPPLTKKTYRLLLVFNFRNKTRGSA